MKYFSIFYVLSSMKKIILGVLFFSFVIGQQPITLEELLKNKLVDVNGIGLGGYQGECVQLEIKNNSPSELSIKIEAGRRLDNMNASQQDILIVKEHIFNLKAGAIENINVRGFCCQSTNHAPNNKSIFTAGFMETGNLLSIATYINNNYNSLDLAAIQSAVWVFSNNQNPGGIIANKSENILGLKKEVARLLEIEIPWYDIYYEKNDSMPFSDKAYSLKGEIIYHLPHTGWMTMVVRNKNGRLYHKFTNDGHIYSGRYTYDVDINIKGWPKGSYAIEVYLDNALRGKFSFTI